VSKEVATVCYSYGERQLEEEALKRARTQADRKRREERAKRDEKEGVPDRDRKLVKA
jgi:hypothetical protein